MTLNIDRSAPQMGAGPPRSLCRFENGEVFAHCERGNEYVRESDYEVWATLHDDVLCSARSGLPLAYRLGHVFFAAESGEPLYYERAF